MIPVSIVTGFLGSGKTTLIGRILRDPGFGRTAVIVNEFGEIGLDHALIASSNETFTALTTGCLCCAVRSDLVRTLLELEASRQSGAASYDRVLIETSGLADPAPILHGLMTDESVAASHAIDTVVTLVDAMHGATTLAEHPEARRQVALADLLVVTKTDLVGMQAGLSDSVAALNTSAPRAMVGAVGPGMLFGGADATNRAIRLANVPDQIPRGLPNASPFDRARHGEGIGTFVVRRERPLPALALTLLLQALTEHCGARLLRVKGLVDIAEMPGQPALVHGVQHVFAPPDFLPAWPTEDRSTRLIFIARAIPPYFVVRLLDAIEAEVREELGL
jgi:G3E family GTPase